MLRLLVCLVLGVQLSCLRGAEPELTPPATSLLLLQVGDSQLRVITPTVLELLRISTKDPDPAPSEVWGFPDKNGGCTLPDTKQFAVTADSKPIQVAKVGFKRRVLYAPLKKRDLRIANYIYLQLASPIPENGAVEVLNPGNALWPSSVHFRAQASLTRLSPVLHVNQTGYAPGAVKLGFVGYYLGTLGELAPTNRGFSILQTPAGIEVHRGELTRRPDKGFPFECYQEVYQADFSAFDKPGEYVLAVPTLGISFPFFIDAGISGAFARANALGIYSQRCGVANEIPFSRFTHGPCHTNLVEVPTMDRRFASVNESLAKESANFKDNPRHTAPQLKDVRASLYPFVNQGPLDLSGGHHDAGDYSKYTINSAGFIHHLVFGVDVFPGVAALDNLGIPESGDGKSDVLQEALWEADFLSKMQDADGGFYFLVYPRDREYEIDVLPDHGDPQIVLPKTTSVTAAAVAALAQCASSPTVKKQFPERARVYQEKALKGWAFLEKAIQKHGKDGAYQKITHYGDEFMHDDELAWAACELFLATGDAAYEKKLIEWLDPADAQTRKWGWWRLYDAYGCAIRSYAFAAQSGKMQRSKLNATLLDQCEEEIAAAGADQLARASASAYGTSFPIETKRVMTAGWYFSSDAAFDLAVACQLKYPEKNDPRPQMEQAIWSNLGYEQGCNPVNVTYLTGLGWGRQREIVHQFAQNDERVLPPPGIPLGNVQGGFGWIALYGRETGSLSFPLDSSDTRCYPIYDRWADAFNLTQEFVILNQARALAYTAWLMARSPLKNQPWRAAAASITTEKLQGPPERQVRCSLSVEGLDLASARIVWEAKGQEPMLARNFTLSGPRLGTAWVEAEAQLPDGRRVVARTMLSR